MSETGREAQKVTLEKVGSHVNVFGAYTRQELRDMLLSSLSLLPTVDDRKLGQTLTHTGLSKEDLSKIKDGEKLDERTKRILKDLKITKDLISEAIDKPKKSEKSPSLGGSQRQEDAGIPGKLGRADESGEPEGPERPEKPVAIISPENDLNQFLRNKGLSIDLMNRILKTGPTDEMIREEEISKFYDLWKASAELQGQELKDPSESCVSISSSSEDYLSLDSLYLKSSFNKPLTEALQDVLSKKPFNPVEYLGHWLLHFKVCQERAERRKDYDAELLAERERIQKLGNVRSESEIFESSEAEHKEDWNFMDYEGV